jgi:hypothetical protein
MSGVPEYTRNEIRAIGPAQPTHRAAARPPQMAAASRSTCNRTARPAAPPATYRSSGWRRAIAASEPDWPHGGGPPPALRPEPSTPGRAWPRRADLPKAAARAPRTSTPRKRRADVGGNTPLPQGVAQQASVRRAALAPDQDRRDGDKAFGQRNPALCRTLRPACIDKAAPAAPRAQRQRRALPWEARPAHAGPHRTTVRSTRLMRHADRCAPSSLTSSLIAQLAA